jgi:uncharacterized protein (TIGR00290 family)
MMGLNALATDDEVEVSRLVTVVEEGSGVVRMHGTPQSLVEAQADALGIPLTVVRVPSGASNETYEQRIGEALDPLRQSGVDTVAAADLFLEDIRSYRESVYRELGMKIVFPIWGRDTRELAATFLDRGYRAVVSSVDTTYLHASFAGRAYDRSFLEDLPEGVDPCGENGEFHTFVTAGPGVQEAIRVEVTGRETDGRMCYARLQPSL